MTLKVCKFGGTSLADASQMKKVKEIIESDENRRIIVPSAPGKRSDDDTKITDLLLMSRELIHDKGSFESLFDKVKMRFEDMIQALEMNFDLEDAFMDIRYNLLKGVSDDYIVSRGEYLNGKLLANYLGYDFIDPVQVIRFDEKGMYDDAATQKLLEEALKDVDRAVIPGFYGGTEKGDVRIFSRGGSDITGAIVARACQADVYENWTDVSGLLMTDPRIVKGAKPIKSISYQELREMSSMGATVIHEDAVYPAQVAAIPINIRNTNRPADPGTFIESHNRSLDDSSITGIAGKKDYAILKVMKNGLSKDKVLVDSLFQTASRHGINYEHMPSTVDSISLVLPKLNKVKTLNTLIDEIYTSVNPDEIKIVDNIALIGVVASNLSNKPKIISTLFGVLSTLGIGVKMIDLGSNDINIIIGVDNEDYEYAIKGIYNAYN